MSRIGTFSLVLLATGCAHTYERPSEVRVAESGATCDLEFRAFEGDIKDGELSNEKIHTDGWICIKKHDGDLAIPEKIALLGTEEWSSGRFNGICEPSASSDEHTCTWSKLYRDNHPLTFQLRTAQLGLGRYLQAVRAYRNGQLVYLWKSTDDGERELTIPASALTARLQPHLAPLDLRLLPVGVEVSVSVLNEIVAKESSGLQQRFHAGFTALLSDSSFAGGKLPDQLKCLEWSARYVQRAALGLVGKEKEVEDPGNKPDSCSETPPPTEGDKLTDLYASFKNRQIATAKQLDDQVENRIHEVASTLGPFAQGAALKAKQEVQAWMQGQLVSAGNDLAKQLGLKSSAEQTMRDIDQILAETAGSFDRLRALHQQLRADAIRIASNTDEQAQLFAKFTEAADAQGSVFSPRRTNPALLPGERALNMKYGDKFQWFGFAPWHTIAIRPTGAHTGADFDLANALPVLDIVGFRYQWGVEGWKEFRMGAGILYIKDPFTSPDDPSKTVDHFNLATQLNINAFGGFVVGVGYVVTNAGAPGSAFWREDRIRVLVGADLIKLITGIKMEAL
jgi:hypothetical protein